MFNYKKFSLPMIFTTFFSYSTNKTELPCANSKSSQCLNCFSYLLPAVDTICSWIEAVNKLFQDTSGYDCIEHDVNTIAVCLCMTTVYSILKKGDFHYFSCRYHMQLH